eukprot:5992577-Pyramimonas_sp.AAC.1
MARPGAQLTAARTGVNGTTVGGRTRQSASPGAEFTAAVAAGAAPAPQGPAGGCCCSRARERLNSHQAELAPG